MKRIYTLLFILGVVTNAFADNKYFLSTTFFSLFNLFPDPPDVYELHVGARFTEKDALSIQCITWKYNDPLGIPYGPDFEAEEYSYPGYVRAFGIGLDYQRRMVAKAFVATQATAFLQRYYDTEAHYLQSGFQLFLRLRAGYHFDVWKDLFFIEPGIAFNTWPLETNVPDRFSQIDNPWPKYFLWEPNLIIGVSF